jgi:POT family proton-dependent oligopeptide transporter
MTTETAGTASGRDMILDYFRSFNVLRDNAPAYWGVQAVNVLDSIAYFSMISVASLFLVQNIGLTEITSGYTITAYGTLVSVTLFGAGFITDALGVRKSLLVAMVIQGASRAGLILCGFMPELPGREWLVIALLVVGAPGNAMVQTAFQAANKMFSSERSRSASFSIWYLLMNVGAAGAGFSIDVVRKMLELDLTWIFVLGGATTLLSVTVTLMLISRDDADSVVETEGGASAPSTAVVKKTGMAYVMSVVRERAFKRMLVLMASLLGVRAVFLYMYLLLPLYWTRVIEDVSGEKTDMGLLQAINPILIVVGIILFIPFSNRYNVFSMLTFGAMISASSLLIMVLPWQLFGADMAQAYFTMSVLMLVVLSVGEVIWSPKLNEYIASIAPAGQEGTYLGMSMVPWFAAKLVVGAISGHLLTRWVPEGIGPQLQAGGVEFWDSPEAMWLLLFVWAISGPLIALVFRRWFTSGMGASDTGNSGSGE